MRAYGLSNDESVCGSKNSCSSQGQIFGVAALAAAASVLPHYIIGGGVLPKNGYELGHVGIGYDAVKEMAFDFKSALEDSSNNTFWLTTSGGLQVYDQQTPSVVRYGIGLGRDFDLTSNLQLLPELIFNLEKIESLSQIKSAPKIQFTFLYSPDDKNRWIVIPSYTYLGYSKTRIDLGYTYHFSKSTTSMLSDLRLGPLISYEDQSYLHKKLFILSLAFGI